MANPAALIGSAAMLLDWLGARRNAPALTTAGRAMAVALDAALADPATRIPDLGWRASTKGMAQAVIAALPG